jgi:hypothetical protein
VTILDTNPIATLTYITYIHTYRTAANFVTLGGIILATTLEANFSDAETVDAVPVDLVTTTKT